MKKVLTLLTAVLCLTVTNAQDAQQKDPYRKTFIQNNQRLPNLQLQTQYRQNQAWENFRSEHGNWWVEFKEETGTPHRAFGKPIATSGITAPERALNFISANLQAYQINTSDLRLIQNNTTAKYHYVSFIQQYNGLDILWSEATVRLNMNNEVCMFGMDIYNNIDISTIPAIGADAIKSFATADFTIQITGVDVVSIPKILPIPGADGRSLCRSIRQRGALDPIFVATPGEVPAVLAEVLKEGDVVLTQGAGNVAQLSRKLAELKLNINAMKTAI